MTPDITEHKRSQAEIMRKTALLEAQLNSTIDGILIVDNNAEKVLQNQRFNDLLKIPEDIATNSDDKPQLEYVKNRAKDPEKFVEKVDYLYSHPEETSRDEVEFADGTILDRYSAPVIGEDGTHFGRIWIFRDITQRKQMEEKLRAISLIDDLTSLRNRRGFFNTAPQIIGTASRIGMGAVLMFADLDGMKRINDTLGHETGDQALIETAEVLRETCRDTDVIARMSGDEFAVLALETSVEPGSQVRHDHAEEEALMARLRQNLEIHNSRENRRFQLSLSFGISRYDPGNPRSLEHVMAEADKRMYENKRSKM